VPFNAAAQTPDEYIGTANFYANVAGHMAIGCAVAAANHGGCGASAVAAGFSAAAGPSLVTAGIVQGTITSSVIGGIGSVIGGGKFESGAVTAAFGYLFNTEGGRIVGGAIGAIVGTMAGAGPEDVPAVVEGTVLGADVGDKVSDWFWGNSDSLQSHFEDHGEDFGATNEQDYARQAQQFFQNGAGTLPTKIDPGTGIIRVYDPNTNTFGAYNPDGSTRTFFKPTSPTYFDRQPGELLR